MTVRYGMNWYCTVLHVQQLGSSPAAYIQLLDRIVESLINSCHVSAQVFPATRDWCSFYIQYVYMYVEYATTQIDVHCSKGPGCSSMLATIVFLISQIKLPNSPSECSSYPYESFNIPMEILDI